MRPEEQHALADVDAEEGRSVHLRVDQDHSEEMQKSMPIREGRLGRLQCAEPDDAERQAEAQQRPFLRAEQADHEEVQSEGRETDER